MLRLPDLLEGRHRYVPCDVHTRLTETRSGPTLDDAGVLVSCDVTLCTSLDMPCWHVHIINKPVPSRNLTARHFPPFDKIHAASVMGCQRRGVASRRGAAEGVSLLHMPAQSHSIRQNNINSSTTDGKSASAASLVRLVLHRIWLCLGLGCNVYETSAGSRVVIVRRISVVEALSDARDRSSPCAYWMHPRMHSKDSNIARAAPSRKLKIRLSSHATTQIISRVCFD